MNIQLNNMYDKILIDCTEELISDFKYQQDIVFLLNKNLVERLNDKIKVNFVGEVITPNSRFISLPKNFDKSDESVHLTTKILKEFKWLKRNDKTLIENHTFSMDNSEIESIVIYFKKLKEYYLDNITYKFIYPKKTFKIHSNICKGSSFDIVQTFINNKRKGPGITYNVNDFSNKNWNTKISITDIYYSTLINLCEEYGSEKDKLEIKNKTDYYKSIGYKFEYIDTENIDDIIESLNNCKINIIHQPVRNTLLNYYNSKGVSEKYKVRVFYTNNFKYVVEYFFQVSLNHNRNFRNIVEWKDPNNTQFRPDVFSEFNDKSMFLDCKYYNTVKSDYFKEMYGYNKCQNNKYPMLIIIPSEVTEFPTDFNNPYYHDEHELLILKVSLKDITTDVINKTKKTILDIHNIVSKKSNRW